MRIAVDLDGVCYEWEKTARYMLRRWYAERNETHPAMLERESCCWDDIMHNVSSEAWKWLWSGAVYDGLFRHGHIVGGTIEGLLALAKDGHELVVATARPKPSAVEDTLAWAALHFRRAPISEIIIHDDKLTARADLYIDDALHNAEHVAAAGKMCVLFDRPWNQGVVNRPRVVRAFGWTKPVTGVVDTVRWLTTPEDTWR